MRPADDYGARRPDVTSGSNHIRYVGSSHVLRLTTDCSITAVLEETPFVLRDALAFVMGPGRDDAGIGRGGGAALPRVPRRTTGTIGRDLSIPFEWQDEIIRAAITLKLAAYDDTGAIVAALTTSIPEAPGSGRNWDYRFCWLRDAYFVVNALNRLDATRTMERYLGYIINVAAGSEGILQPV